MSEERESTAVCTCCGKIHPRSHIARSEIAAYDDLLKAKEKMFPTYLSFDTVLFHIFQVN